MRCGAQCRCEPTHPTHNPSPPPPSGPRSMRNPVPQDPTKVQVSPSSPALGYGVNAYYKFAVSSLMLQLLLMML